MFGKFRGQPRGVFVMFATEFWERFSYYGFMGIMVLFMVADLNAGGLGYDRSRALFLFGLDGHYSKLTSGASWASTSASK